MNPANILINILLKIHFTGVLISPLPDLLPDVFCFDGENISFDASLLYRVSQEERTKLREGVPYVKLYRYNPKHLCPKLNGY